MKIIKFLFFFSIIIHSCKSDDSGNIVDDIENSGLDQSAENAENETNNESQDVVGNPLVNRAPEAFNLLSFADEQENVQLVNVIFSWETAVDPDGDEVTYDLILEEDSDMPSVKIAENLTDTSFQLGYELQRSTSYSWQVIARDSEGATSSSGIFTFRTKPITITKLSNDAEFDGRTEHATVLFDDRIWIIGGTARFEVADDVWSSRDGINWIKETNNAGFISRGGHTCVVFKNKIWIIGGFDNSGEFLNDVWSSSDGVNWVKENIDSGFGESYNHTAVVYNDKIWLIGGKNTQSEFNDVWFSEDGINWQLATINPGFPGREGHEVLVFNDRIYILGGINSNQGRGFGALNDVWSSSDGINWKLETIDAEFSPRWGHSSVVYENKIWIFGGLGSGRRNDIWSSKDGVNWKNESPQIPYSQEFSARFSHTTDTFQNRILMLGGNDGSRRNDIISFE